MHAVFAVVCVGSGQIFASEFDTDVYRSVPVSVPTFTGVVPAITVAVAICGKQFGIDVHSASPVPPLGCTQLWQFTVLIFVSNCSATLMVELVGMVV